ncbi:Glucan endo-1,3-beta-glucosidase [Thalictrum thalictroides]|uniref:glucan endo-1,3-beta-D-glucosidase n=1 Tax=Thalictrum thalictroides TaxID=46969 RepID=A0A7J6WEF5_THATH|nr:Glucan endo-1,3-beta-glucosidase [Thalictrum thalictroides]
MEISCFFNWFLLLYFVASRNGLVTVQAFTGSYGINYGRIANNIPSPESVVTLLKGAMIKNVRIYDADHNVLQAFKGSGLELVVNVPNEFLKEMSTNEDRAMSWVKENVQPYLPETHIRGITVGNEVLGGSDQELQEALLGAVKNIYKAVDNLHLADLIQISTAHSQAVFSNSYPPSACIFRENIVQYMKPLLQFFSQINSPFFINIYPFLSYMSDPEHINLNYALFEPNPGIHDEGTKLHYDNMFDAQVDASYAALENAGFKHMEVIVSETGWASHGDDNEAVATPQHARTYNYNLRKRLALKKGTPFRPHIMVRAYVFALFNENLKTGATSERNFGLFKADGSISYNIGFPGLKPSSSPSSYLYLKNMRAHGCTLSYSKVVAACAAVLLLILTP